MGKDPVKTDRGASLRVGTIEGFPKCYRSGIPCSVNKKAAFEGRVWA